MSISYVLYIMYIPSKHQYLRHDDDDIEHWGEKVRLVKIPAFFSILNFDWLIKAAEKPTLIPIPIHQIVYITSFNHPFTSTLSFSHFHFNFKVAKPLFIPTH